MPTAYEDQFFSVDPGAPPAVGTALTFSRVEFVDEDDDGNIETGTGDTFNGVAISQVWPNDTLTVNVPGVGNITYTGVTFYLASGTPVFTPTDGQVLQNGTFVSSTFVTTATQTPVGSFGPTCFTPGTMIETPAGGRLIEDLLIGDMVTTLDQGPQAIRKILDNSFRAAGVFAPIQFDPGSIGNDAPLCVSPQHRILVTGWQAELYFGQHEVLVAAKHLVNGDTIRQVTGGEVRYIHLMFDAHQIVFGQGVPSESYFAGPAQSAGDDPVMTEMLMLYPHLATTEPSCWTTARPVLGRFEAALLAA
ncbi:Hint domain-containing protein [Sulfitobacter sp. F26204]|uniref:Hint domain-containing protein n=1 Tax=Sulfitobacter sp. F26204 TaxID=2996014 RepID=UPI00225E1A9F|nr:Hint domain-containing protein [Sulfitobacter sp. F26204]MCX7558370.1 Hint domain-containing protein [Sulfitobacter sp. F26204]